MEMNFSPCQDMQTTLLLLLPYLILASSCILQPAYAIVDCRKVTDIRLAGPVKIGTERKERSYQQWHCVRKRLIQ